MGMSHDFEVAVQEGSTIVRVGTAIFGPRTHPVGQETIAVTVTPLDLPTQQFKTSVRGFDRREVAEFLSELAADYEDALREADRLRDDLGRAQSLVEEHREQERTLRGTLMTAQKLADEIRSTAEQESQRIIAEGQARAAALLETTTPRTRRPRTGDRLAACAARESRGWDSVHDRHPASHARPGPGGAINDVMHKAQGLTGRAQPNPRSRTDDGCQSTAN